MALSYEGSSGRPEISQMYPAYLQPSQELDVLLRSMTPMQMNQMVYDIDVAKLQKVHELQQLEAMEVMWKNCSSMYANREQELHDAAYDTFIKQAESFGIDLKPNSADFDTTDKARNLRTK